MGWKRIRSKQLLDHPRLSVFEDDVVLPNGHETKYMRFGSLADSAMVLAQDASGKFLIQKEYSYPPDEWLYQLPGGAIEKGETPEAGALRELAEEAGFAGDIAPLGWFYVHNRRSDQKMHTFIAMNLREVPLNPDPEESFENHWFSEKEIDDLIKRNEIRNYTLLSAWAQFKSAQSTR